MEKCLISVDRFTESSQDSLTHGPHSRLDLKMGKSSLISTSLYFASSIFTSSILFLSFLRPSDLKSQLMSWPSMPTIALFGCLMYTRDFRWEVDSEREKDARSRPLNVLKNETVDVPYSDNTYCNPSYDFPTREVAVLTINVHCGEWIPVNRDEVWIKS
ncbi:hypothetical protein NC652_031721 [Populus alba x Populus x berolinensis]|nr:hypothetical protein NC652_031721 [Populus alba x Populus x berolinensis]